MAKKKLIFCPISGRPDTMKILKEAFYGWEAEGMSRGLPSVSLNH